jgi:hypothetical protein
METGDGSWAQNLPEAIALSDVVWGAEDGVARFKDAAVRGAEIEDELAFSQGFDQLSDLLRRKLPDNTAEDCVSLVGHYADLPGHSLPDLSRATLNNRMRAVRDILEESELDFLRP